MSAEELISIHAPRMGSDPCGGRYTRILRNFNPRSPWGERHSASCSRTYSAIFQSTLPAWGATQCFQSKRYGTKFQSTLPAWGATVNFLERKASKLLFQSTLPAWGATSEWMGKPARMHTFQSTLPAWGATFFPLHSFVNKMYFNPRSPHGERPSGLTSLSCNGISIHAPRMGSDWRWRKASSADSDFNPRSPHGERQNLEAQNAAIDAFQSTLPAWGATS